MFEKHYNNQWNWDQDDIFHITREITKNCARGMVFVGTHAWNRIPSLLTNSVTLGTPFTLLSHKRQVFQLTYNTPTKHNNQILKYVRLALIKPK